MRNLTKETARVLLGNKSTEEKLRIYRLKRPTRKGIIERDFGEGKASYYGSHPNPLQLADGKVVIGSAAEQPLEPPLEFACLDEALDWFDGRYEAWVRELERVAQ